MGGKLTYGSVCSGIEAATAAWHTLGWKPAFFSEIEAFPRAVLQHHYPEVPLHGDFTTIRDGEYRPIDLLVGGTPCQSFSVAGLRGGLDDDRGNLALEYLRLADRLRPRWLVWENVPGVLSSNGGRDFGAILGGMVELGYGFAYRVLDAVHFGVPHRRRRVFVVGHRGSWQRAAAVLLERGAFQNHAPPSGEDGAIVAATVSTRVADGSLDIFDQLAAFERIGLASRRFTPLEVERLLGFPDGYTSIPQALYDAVRKAGTKPVVPLRSDDGAVRRDAGEAERQVRALRRRDGAASGGPLPPGGSGEGHPLSPLQHQAAGRGGHGLGDAGLGLPGRIGRTVADGPRYKALGNSMAVPVMAWIGQRIEAVEAITSLEQAA